MPTTLCHVILRMYKSLWQNPQFYSTDICETYSQCYTIRVHDLSVGIKHHRNKLMFYHLKQALCKLYHYWFFRPGECQSKADIHLVS